MKRIRLSLALSLITLCLTPVMAQVDNYALKLNGTDQVNCGKLEELNASQACAIQFYMCPSEWTAGAYLFKRGNGEKEFSARLSTVNGEVIFKIGSQEIVAKDINSSSWSQLTFASFDNGVDIWVNRTKTWNTITGFSIPTSTDDFVIGQNFKGRLDEFRVWDTEMPSAEEENLMFQNTVNKFHPKYDNLVMYYKFDQNQCPDNIVDYKFVHHGVMNGAITREIVTDNEDFRYRIISGYSDFNRHSDRSQINRDTHLMTNDLIMLVADVSGSEGTISMAFADNEGILKNVDYVPEYDGRNGVLSFKGEGSSMDVGTETFRSSQTASDGDPCFEGWFYIEQWVEGANLLNKKQDDSNYIRIYLGNADTKTINVDVCGNVFSFDNKIQSGKWEHIAFNFVSKSLTTKGRIKMITGEGTAESSATSAPSTINGNFNLNNYTDAPTLLGEGFVGKMDEMMLWRLNRAKGSVATDAKGTSADLTFPVGGFGNVLLDAYWKCDDAKNPGKDTKSWKTMLQQLKDVYAGYDGFKVRVGLVSSETNGGEKMWCSGITRAEWRENLANSVSEILPYCDGIDVDFEWLYSGDSRWASYGEMVQALRDVIPSDKVFSVSLHPIAYWVPKAKIPLIDYVTLQNYGPRATESQWTNYQNSFNNLRNQGFTSEQIHLSIPTTAVKADNSGSPQGYFKLVAQNPDFTVNSSSLFAEGTIDGAAYVANSCELVKKKQQYILDNKGGGTMYFDMGNDLSVQDDRSLIRALNSVIASNVDTLVTKVEMNPSAIINEKDNNRSGLSVYPNPAKDYVIIDNLQAHNDSLCELFTISGTKLLSKTIKENDNRIDVNGVSSGIYLLKVNMLEDTFTTKLQIE